MTVIDVIHKILAFWVKISGVGQSNLVQQQWSSVRIFECWISATTNNLAAAAAVSNIWILHRTEIFFILIKYTKIPQVKMSSCMFSLKKMGAHHTNRIYVCIFSLPETLLLIWAGLFCIVAGCLFLICKWQEVCAHFFNIHVFWLIWIVASTGKGDDNTAWKTDSKLPTK